MGSDANINILEAIQLLNAAQRTLSAATVVNCFHKSGVVLQDYCESESESDTDMVNSWQNLCQN